MNRKLENSIDKIITSYKQLVKAAVLCSLLFILTACPANDQCVYADDFGQWVNEVARISPKDKFTNSTIKIAAGEPLYMRIGGSINICPVSTTLSSNNISPSKNAWQVAGSNPNKDKKVGLVLEKNQLFNMSISGSYTSGNKYTGGEGLYAFIAEHDYKNLENRCTHPWQRSSVAPCVDEKGRKFVLRDGKGNIFEPDNANIGYMAGWFEQLQSATIDRYVFHLKNNGTVGVGSGYAGSSPVTGSLFFKYANRPDFYPPRTDRDSVETVWSRDRTCEINIFGTLFNCRWTGTDYADSTDGYTIDISSGCIGRFGRYLKAVIVPNPVEQNVGELHVPQFYSSRAGGGTKVVTGCIPKWWQESCKPIILSSPQGCTPDESEHGNCRQKLVWRTPNNNDCAATKPNVASDRNCQIHAITNGSKTTYPVKKIYSPLRGASMDLDPLSGNVSAAGVFNGTAPASGELWFQVIDEVTHPTYGLPTYIDNVGEYAVKVRTSKVESGFSRFVNMLIDPFIDIVVGDPNDPAKPGMAMAMFNGVVGDKAFIYTVRAALALYIVIYGFLYIMGMVRDHKEEFIKRVLKVSVVLLVLISPASWQFFNTYLFQGFLYGIGDLTARFTSEITGSSSFASLTNDPLTGQNLIDPTTSQKVAYSITDPFSFINATLARFFSPETMAKLAGLVFSTPLGIVYVIFIFFGMKIYIYAILRGILVYMMAFLALAILIALAPIFIVFLLFEKTKGIFTTWINQLFNFTIQPVLVITVLSIFNIFVYSAIYTVLHFTVCLDCVAGPFTIGFGDLWFDFCLWYFYKTYDSLADGGLPVQFFTILTFIIICNAMKSVIDWMGRMSAQITSGTIATNLSSFVVTGVKGVFNEFKGMAETPKDMKQWYKDNIGDKIDDMVDKDKDKEKEEDDGGDDEKKDK